VSPFSGPVLLAAALISSPALWAALVDGTLSPEVAFTRYLLCAGLVWAGFAVLAMLIGPPPRPTLADPADADSPDAGAESVR
jgi:hypothetical protein